MHKNALPIRTMLFAAFLLVGLLPMVLMSVLAFNEAKSALSAEILHDLNTRAKATASEIDRLMFERLQNVVSWSQLEVMQDARIGDVDKRLSVFLHELKLSYRDVYSGLYVVDTSGRIIASSEAASVGQIYAFEKNWLKLAMPQRTVLLANIHHQKLPMMTLLTDPIDGQAFATLVVEFNWQNMSHVLESAVAGRSSAALLDKDEKIIAQTKNWLKENKGYVIKVDALTNHYLGLSWHLAIAQHKSEVMSPVRHMLHIFIWLLIGSIIFAALIGLPLARSISKPLAALTKFAQHFMHTSSKHVPPADGPAEVRELTHAFAKMISDLEQSREALTRAAKLAVAGEMAAAMSHEVRTPLGILRSSAQILLREPSLSAEAKEVCGFIMSETERLNKLVTTLIEAGRPRSPEYISVNLSDLAEQAAAMMRMQADKKSISLLYQKPEPMMAACDAEQITQVLLNLLLNAIQILPQGGAVSLSITQQAEYAVIEVADNGTGVPIEMQTQIFDPFFTGREGGIGLGLAVVRQIVEAHQGNITVSNGAPASAMPGAHFRVQLPIFGRYRE